MIDLINKIGITTKSAPTNKLEDVLHDIKVAGFSNVMIDHYQDLEHDIVMAQKMGLTVTSVHLDSRNVNELWQNAKIATPIINRITNEFAILARNGVKTAIIHPGQNNYDFTTSIQPITQQGLRNWQNVVAQAERHNILLAIENVDPAHLPHLCFLLDNIQSANLKFCYDSGHHNLFIPEVDLIGKYANILQAIHLHDNDLSFPQKVGWSGDLHLVPLDGKINFEKITKQIAHSSYNGPTMLESSCKDERYNQMSQMEFYQHAYANGKKLSKLILANRQIETDRELI